MSGNCGQVISPATQARPKAWIESSNPPLPTAIELGLSKIGKSFVAG